MTDLKKVIKGFECCILRDPDDHTRCSQCPYDGNCVNRLKMDALELLKAQEEERKRMITWLAKFCRHIDNGDRWLTDQENLEFFKEKMKRQFGWEFPKPPKEET